MSVGEKPERETTEKHREREGERESEGMSELRNTQK